MQTIIKEFMEISYFGLSIFEVIVIFFIIFISFLTRTIFANLVLSKIKKIVITSKNEIDDKIFLSLQPP